MSEAFKKIQSLFFSPPENCVGNSFSADNLTKKELEIKMRWEGIFTHWLGHPELTDKNLVKFVMETFGVAQSQAYIDISNVRELLGNVRSAKKEWYLHVVNQLLLEVISNEKDKKNPDPAIIISAVDKLGKYNKLDQTELEEVPWDQIIPPNWTPTTDISALQGVKRIKDLPAKMKELKKRYYGEAK